MGVIVASLCAVLMFVSVTALAQDGDVRGQDGNRNEEVTAGPR